MLEDKQREKEILEANYYLNKRKDARTKKAFMRKKNRIFLLSIFLGLVLIITTYFVSNKSNIYHISVVGNIYLSDEDVKNSSGLSMQDKFLFVFPNKVENNLEKNSLIASSKVEKLNGNLIKITISEHKAIGYAYEDNKAVIVLDNDGRYELNNTNMYLINKVPLLEGFSKEQISLIIKGFDVLDSVMISQISEIHRYPFSYDENMLEVVMKDGNYVFVSRYDLETLNNYYNVISSFDALDRVCLYLDRLTNTGYISKCPWEEQ